jgi:hypothetical protein
MALKTVRRLAISFVMLLAILGVSLAHPAEASANTLTRGEVYLSCLSTQKYVGVASKYGGHGKPGFIQRCHRLGAGIKVKSVYVPKGCLLSVNGTAFYRGWTSGQYANIGKANYKKATLLMVCF